jgi:ABC-2 type transport system permease protein
LTTATAEAADLRPRTDVEPAGHPSLAIALRSFRQLRISAPALGVTFGAVAASAALTYVSSFPTAASRQALASSLEGASSFSVLFGQVNAIDTVGGYTNYKCYVFLTTIGAIWAALAVTRLLRGEEETGRWQLVLAGRTNPARATTATIAAVAAAIGVVFVGTTTLTMLAGTRPEVGFSAVDSAMFGLSIVVAPLVFAASATMCSQLARTRRLATGLSIGTFAIAFVIRMIGDASPSSHWVLWATPLGWVELMRPFTANDPWPLVPAAGLTGALCLAAVVLASRRDAGGGILATNETSRVRPFGLRSALGLATRLNTPVLGGWAAGIAAVAFIFGIVTKAAASAVAESPSTGTTLTKLGATGHGATQYLAVVFLLTGAVLALVPASQVGSARDEEASGRFGLIVAGPPTRTTWLAGRLALAAAAILATGLLAGAATWAGAKSQGLDVALGPTLVAGLNVVPTAWLALAIGAIALAFIPRIGSAVVYTVVGWSLIIDLVGSLVTSLGWLTRLSLFHYVALAPAEDANWVALAVYTLTAAALALIAVVAFDHRDLATD